MKCAVCGKQIMIGSMMKVYCQGHSQTYQDKRKADKATRLEWIENNPPDEYGYWLCYLDISPMCLKRVNQTTMSIDHVYPKSRGNKYRHDLSNLKPACLFCNQLKGSRTIESLARVFPHLRDLLSS